MSRDLMRCHVMSCHRVMSCLVSHVMSYLLVQPPPDGLPSTSPPLAVTQLFWRACTILLITCAHNTDTIGAIARAGVPTLCVLMDMLMTDVWSFPPLPAPQHDAMLHAKHDTEQQWILTYENMLPENRATHVTRTAATSLYLQHQFLMLLEPAAILRVPPAGKGGWTAVGCSMCRWRCTYHGM